MEQDMIEYLADFVGDNQEFRRTVEATLAKTRQRIAELEANPPTPMQTLAWLKATEEAYIDRRNEMSADSGPDLEDVRTEMTADIAEIREQISKLEPAKSPAEQKEARRTLLLHWFTNQEFLKRLSKLIVLNSFRNGPLEGIHAGTSPSSKTGDYSDVKIVSPFGEIPWTELSRISQEEMKELMIFSVNHVFSILHELVNGPNFEHIFAALQMYSVNPHWNEPELDPEFTRFLREQLGQNPAFTAFFTGGRAAPIA
jgi:hypothetical protein